MGFMSPIHWIIVLVVVLLLFGGKGKISSIMGDFGKGLKSFKKGMKDSETETAEEETKSIRSETSTVGDAAVEKDQAAKS